jgi:general secretion pathway protein C
VAVQAAVAPEASRFKLLGVVAAPPAVSRAQGVALIAVDGKMARAFRVGAAVDGDLVLQSVQPRAVSIGPRGSEARVSLELPPLPPPATGVPGEAVSAAPAAVAPPPTPVAPPAAALTAPPPQLAVPPGAGNLTLQQQLRLRGMRPLNSPTGAVQTPLQVMPGQADDGAAESGAPHDGRNLR